MIVKNATMSAENTTKYRHISKIGCISDKAHNIIYLCVGISWLQSDTYLWAVFLEAALYNADFLVTDFASFLSRRFFPSFTSINFSKMLFLISKTAEG